MIEPEQQDFSADDAARFALGAALRARVLGADHVARSGATTFNEANQMQRLMTQLGWGTIWQRGELDLKTRSLITVAMLVALNRPHELRIHLCGAVNNGATEAEIRESVIHAILYCGFPAAVDAMRFVDELFAESSAE